MTEISDWVSNLTHEQTLLCTFIVSWGSLIIAAFTVVQGYLLLASLPAFLAILGAGVFGQGLIFGTLPDRLQS